MAIHEAWLFEDDSVLVKFDNGCSLQLSSCGGVFRGSSPTDDIKNSSVRRSKETQQRSQFATTFWKDMVKQAVEFRNKFACIPYLCHNLSEITTAAEHKLVTSMSCTWPGEDVVENIYHGDGSISLSSEENNATVILSACKQSFIVDFLCKIQSEKQLGSEKPAYSWVKQIHSTNTGYPSCFYYPMNLLSVGTMMNNDAELPSAVVSDLPQSLLQQCKKPHLHRWRSHWNAEKIGSSEVLDKELIKVFYSENVFYRFYHEKYLIAEVMLPDGSVLRSTGPTYLYFKHWVYDSESESVKENVYSAKAPPITDQTSSIAKILNTASRYLKYLSVCWKRQTTTLSCCWKNENDALVDVESELEYSSYIRNYGSFKKYRNGKMRIVFCDGAIMDFYDPNEDKRKTRSKEEVNCYSENEKTALVDHTGFKLILPNGISFKSSFDSPAGSYNRYVQTALDFIKWKRDNAEKELQLDDENSNRVYQELEKLKRFNASRSKEEEHLDTYKPSKNGSEIVVNEISNSLPGQAHLVTPPLPEVRNMQKYLNDTRKAIGEIDLILQNCKRQLEKR